MLTRRLDSINDSRAISEQGQEELRSDAKLHVLVVDDDETNRIVLEMMLHKAGHTVLLARDGKEAVSVCESKRPDLILMDIMMPVMDGYRAARLIKSTAGNSFIPIIFLTALTDEQALAKCLAVGGDDFITKPVSRVILQAKLLAAARSRELYQELERQRHDLSVVHERLRYEHEIAEQVFTKVVGGTRSKATNIRSELLPFAITNGDLLLVGKGPTGCQYVLLGDCTGHGLSAAIGAIPVADIFYAMTTKGLGIREIVAEINRKLHATLPTGQFLAACLIEWVPHEGSVKIWNGGIPDLIRIAESDRAVTVFPSRNLPLGIVDSDNFAIDVEVRRITHGDRIFLYSDGLVDACNDAGEMFGQEKLIKIIENNRDRSVLFDEIRHAAARFRGSRPQEDDIALVEIICNGDLLKYEGMRRVKPVRGVDYELAVNLGPETLRYFDSMSLVNTIVDGVVALESHRCYLFTVISELYANALEHGILGLDCALKETPEGFTEYYAERERLLSMLDEGWLHINIEYLSETEGGKLIFQIEDSGNGFDADLVNNDIRADGLMKLGGRGMELVRSLCESLIYDLRGNYVRAIYAWRN